MGRLLNLRSIVRLVVSLVLIGFLLWRIDLTRLGHELAHANYVFVIPALALFSLAKLLVARRWRLMMSDFEPVPPLNFLFGVLLVSNLANNVLPARLGDVIRVQVPAERYGSSRARLTSTVFATESLLDGIALVSFGLIGLALVDLHGFPTGIFWGALGLLIGSMAAVIPLSHLELREGWTCNGILKRLPDRAQDFLETSVPHFIDGLVVFKEMHLAVPAIALSFTIWGLEVIMFWLFGLAFDVHISLPAWMLVMVAANMISSLPITPSNIGTYELAVAELLRALGVEAGTAGGFAIAVHAFNIAWITVMGFVALWWLKLSVADVFSFGPKSEAEEEQRREAERAIEQKRRERDVGELVRPEG